MSKKQSKSVFVCDSCGNEFSLWSGQCSVCGLWNTLKELKLSANSSKLSKSQLNVEISPVSKRVKDNKINLNTRIKTGFEGLDMILGDGFVPGEVVLVAGEPGIGKSTLLLEVCVNFAEKGDSVIYFSAEESEDQLLNRYQRIAKSKAKQTEENLFITYQSSVEQIVALIEKYSPKLVIVDSIQAIASEMIDSAPGNLSQVRQSGVILAEVAKRKGTIVVIVGQVTKDGTIAGPKVVEHLVDCVLKFEGDRQSDLRVLRSSKNRFGSTDEVCFFTILNDGMHEIKDPSRFFISQSTGVSGVAKSIILQGNRPVLVEVQALINKSNFGYPKRLSEGYSRNRLELLAAIIAKRLSIDLSDQDIYIKVLGGLNVKDPAIDLAVISAIISVYKNKALSSESVYIGEVSLSGQILGVSRAEFRLKQAKSSGINAIFSGKVSSTLKENVTEIPTVKDLSKQLF